MFDILSWLDCHPNLAAWVSGLVSLIAVVVALFAIYYQKRHVMAAEKVRIHRAEAMTLLAMLLLAGELKRMCLLVGYQIDQEGNEIIYPDISAEFTGLSTMLAQLPIDSVSARGKISEMLQLRRIANEMSILFQENPKQGEGFYLNNRTKITGLEQRCSKCKKNLAESLQAFAPDLHENHKEEIQSR